MLSFGGDIKVDTEMVALAQAKHRSLPDIDDSAWLTDDEMRVVLEAAIAVLNRPPF